uniref:Uncharacterized protein ycf35 n=1 Tax=Anotrichium furcellatum TaxID=41999 RepID=A0A4D6WPX3_9FLOR|nr:hypothetical protein [Anotrichium furcellatum]
MSHFSKIVTSITKEKPLILALTDFGLFYRIDNCSSDSKRIYVYNKLHDSKDFIFYFDWDGYSYSLIADVILWSLDMNFEVFLEKLNQRYAFHAILEQSQYNGFQEKSYHVMHDGSIKLVIEKLSNLYS